MNITPDEYTRAMGWAAEEAGDDLLLTFHASWNSRAENIARGQQDAAEVMESWMTSAGHRANILNCSLTRLGVGVAQGSGGPWWTQLFG